jgi:hypothetical protein
VAGCRDRDGPRWVARVDHAPVARHRAHHVDWQLLLGGRHERDHVSDPMTERPAKDQITAAMHRAADAARARTRSPDRIAEFPRGVDDCEPAEDGWWHIGWIGVVGEPEEWNVLFDTETDEGRLRKVRR